VPDEDGRRLKPGMRVQIDMLATFKREEYGLLEGTVRSVSPQAVNEAEVSSLVANSVIVKSIFQSGAKTQVVVALTPDAQSPTGYAWSSGSGPDGSIHAGTQIAASVEVASRRPISLVLPVLRDLLGAS
jgi:HlyD family secretion protein